MWPWPKVRLLFCTRGQQASLSRSVICLTRFRVYQKRKLVLSIHARFGLLLEQRWPNPEAPTLETGMAFSMCPVPNPSAFWAWPWQAGDFGTHGGSVRCTVLSWSLSRLPPKRVTGKGWSPVCRGLSSSAWALFTLPTGGASRAVGAAAGLRCGYAAECRRHRSASALLLGPLPTPRRRRGSAAGLQQQPAPRECATLPVGTMPCEAASVARVQGVYVVEQWGGGWRGRPRWVKKVRGVPRGLAGRGMSSPAPGARAQP